MSLFRLRLRRNRARANKARLRAYTTLRCPLNGHQVSWCRNLCEPMEGMGLCGRPAPHVLVGKTQRAIADYQARQAEPTSRR